MKQGLRAEVERVVGDLHIVVENHSDILRNNALPFRILIGLRTIGLLLSVFRAPFAFLSLTPIQLFSIEIWRLATCAFVGKNLILFAWTVFSLHVGTNLVRQASSNETLLKIFAITQLVSTCAASFFAFLTYFINRGSTIVYDNHVIDFVAINSAVLVLIKQFLPDSILFATPFGRVKYTHLPFMGLITAGIIALVGLVEPIVFIQVAVGIQVSWTYLRFFHPHETDAIYGDASEHFTWASLFPRALQPLCTVAGRIVFRSLVRLGVCKRQVRHVDLNSLQTVPINLPALDSSAKDAERRRQKALRDLNERLSKTKRVETIEWDDDEKEEQQLAGPSSKRPQEQKQKEQREQEEPELVVSSQPQEETEEVNI